MTDKTAAADKPATAPAWSLLESAIWSPAKAGETVTGSLGPPEMGPFGEQHTLVTDDGVTVLPHLTTLKDLSRVPLGTMVRITYTGEQTSKAGNTYRGMTIETAPSPGGGAA